MSYADEDFWTKYRDYLAEVHNAHLNSFRTVAREQVSYQRVLNLGCGRYNEASDLLPFDHISWFNVDANEPAHLKADWTTGEGEAAVVAAAKVFMPDTMVSLFATELSFVNAYIPQYAVNWFYRYLLQEVPSLQRIVVAGFYYNDQRRAAPVVEEVGGLRSAQSISKVLRGERRLLVPTPSTLFGPDVVEVWRCIERAR